MRIIAGEFKRKRIHGPLERATTRPMPDRVKEAVFNLLRGHVEGQTVVDAFCGAGTMGLEALSRGAGRCVFIEKDKQVIPLLKRNIEDLGVSDRAEVLAADALAASTPARVGGGAHLVFYDPPYAMLQDRAQRGRALRVFARYVGLLDEEGYAVLRAPEPLADPGEGGGPPAPVSLEVEGCEGPESHAYGSMGVHLYMRPRPGGGGAGG